MPPTNEELLAILRERYPHLNEDAIRSLLEQVQISRRAEAPYPGEYTPGTNQINIRPDREDVEVPTTLHELTHFFDFEGTTEPQISAKESNPGVGGSRTTSDELSNLFGMSQGLYSADRALMNQAGLQAPPVPGYLTPHFGSSFNEQRKMRERQERGEDPLEGAIQTPTSIAEYAQQIANVPSDTWGGSQEALAELMVMTGGDFALLPPQLLPELAPLGASSTQKATTYEQASQEFVKLPPKVTPRQGNLPQFINKAPKRSAYKPPASVSSKPKRTYKSKSRRNYRPRTRTRGMGGLSEF